MNPPGTSSAPTSGGRPRLEVVDSARVLATIGVIWTHVVEVQGHPPRVAALGRFGTSFYILAAVLFAYRGRTKEKPPSWQAELKVRARRLLVPYVVWSLLYGALYYQYGVGIGLSSVQIAEWWGPLAGTARHLWFLPFAFLAGSLCAVSADWLRRLETPVLATLAGLGIPFAYWFFQGHLFFWLDRPWELSWHLHRLDRWIEELPLALAAIVAFPLIDRLVSRSSFAGPGAEPPSTLASRAPVPRHFFAIFTLAAFVLIEWAYFAWVEPLQPWSGGESRVFAHVLGALLLATALLLRDVASVRRLSRVGRHTYFVFLGHVIVLDMVNGPLQGLPSFGSLGLSAIVTLTIFAFGTLVGPIFLRTPVLRFFYPR